MKSMLYYGARKLLGQGSRNQLKLWNYKLQKKMTSFYLWRNGRFSTADLQSELRRKLPDNFEVLMVHSSHSNMLPMYSGDLPELLEVLLELTGPDRTLVMPAFFFGSRKYNYDVIKYYSDKPEIDMGNMPSQMGLLTEMFRKLPGVKTSLHPTHRISALGPLAGQLTTDHEFCRTGCGKGSPFDKMTRFNTLILGIGVHYYRSMTQTHAPEDLLFEQGKYPTKFKSTEVPVTMLNEGRKIEHTLNFLDRVNYQRKVHPLLKRLMGKELVEWNFHGVPLYYSYADLVTKKLKDAALAGVSAFS